METPKKMAKKIRNKWVKALRSGRYVQGKKQLCKFYKDGRPAKYCCLGVLARVVKPNLRPSDFEKAGVLAEMSIRLDGLPTGLQGGLAGINDSGKASEADNGYLVSLGYKPFPKGRATFSKIAEWVEKNL